MHLQARLFSLKYNWENNTEKALPVPNSISYPNSWLKRDDLFDILFIIKPPQACESICSPIGGNWPLAEKYKYMWEITS